MDTFTHIDILMKMTLGVLRGQFYLKLGVGGSRVQLIPYSVTRLQTRSDRRTLVLAVMNPRDYRKIRNKNRRCPHKTETTQTKERSCRLRYAAHGSWNRGEIAGDPVKDICHYYSSSSRGKKSHITSGHYKRSCN
jgi:hypothetical protein